jgi:hypothetical protein
MVKPPGQKREDGVLMSQAQLEITKAAIAASAQITASMVAVTNEKNPAKISEAFRVIYKTVVETVKGTSKKPDT